MSANILVEFIDNLRHGPNPLWMPWLEYTALAWLLRIVLLAIACILWYFSVKRFKKNRWGMLGIVSFLAFIVLFIASFEIDIVIHQCPVAVCSRIERETFFGIMGILIHKVNDHYGRCNCNDTKKVLLKTAEVRHWGGIIPFLPSHDNLLTKIDDFPCPTCGN